MHVIVVISVVIIDVIVGGSITSSDRCQIHTQPDNTVDKR